MHPCMGMTDITGHNAPMYGNDTANIVTATYCARGTGEFSELSTTGYCKSCTCKYLKARLDKCFFSSSQQFIKQL